MAYDPASGKLVLHGGMNPNDGTLLGDTWRWDGRTMTWTQESAPGPSPRVSPAMATDPKTGGVVLFGGCGGTATTAGCAYFDDTWTWNGATRSWARRSPAESPPPRAGTGLTNDDARNRVMLFGGYNGCCISRDSWAWDGTAGTWTRLDDGLKSPAHRGFHSLAYDKVRHRVVLFGGVGGSGALGDTWTYGAPL